MFAVLRSRRPRISQLLLLAATSSAWASFLSGVGERFSPITHRYVHLVRDVVGLHVFCADCSPITRKQELGWLSFSRGDLGDGCRRAVLRLGAHNRTPRTPETRRFP